MRSGFPSQSFLVKMFTLTQFLITVALVSSVVFALPAAEGGIFDDKEIIRAADKRHSPGDVSDRLQGGKRATPGQFPHQMSIRLWHEGISLGHRCSGTIITNRFVLTAAFFFVSAFPKIQNYRLVVGTNKLNDINGTEYNIKRWIIHEDYFREQTERKWTIRNDIALIESATTIKFDKLVGPIALHDGFIKEGARAVIAGWGHSKVSEPTHSTSH